MSLGINHLFNVKYISKLFSSTEVQIHKIEGKSREGSRQNGYNKSCKSRKLLQGSWTANIDQLWVSNTAEQELHLVVLGQFPVKQIIIYTTNTACLLPSLLQNLACPEDEPFL